MKQNAKILIIDDNLEFQTTLKRALEQKGYSVTTERNSWNGIFALQNFKPDLVILDINMPEMDGIGTMEVVRKIDSAKQIPIIFLTGESEKEKVLKAINLGADGFVRKPFNLTQLFDRISQQLHIYNFSWEDLLKIAWGPNAEKQLITEEGISKLITNDYQAYKGKERMEEVCIVLPKTMPLVDISTLSEDQASKVARVFLKRANGWKYIWPFTGSKIGKWSVQDRKQSA